MQVGSDSVRVVGVKGEVVIAGEGWRRLPAPDVTSDFRRQLVMPWASSQFSARAQQDGTRARIPGWARAAVCMRVVLE